MTNVLVFIKKTSCGTSWWLLTFERGLVFFLLEMASHTPPKFSNIVGRAVRTLPPDPDAVREICAMLREGEVARGQAFELLKNKLRCGHPHMILSTLYLLDIMVKNSDKVVHEQVITQECMDELVSLLQRRKAKPKSPGAVPDRLSIEDAQNQDIRVKILDILRTLRDVFGSASEFRFVMDTVKKVRTMGLQISPQKNEETVLKNAKEFKYEGGRMCYQCGRTFEGSDIKHPCWNCGQKFCAKCSSKTSLIPQFNIAKPRRVCDTCYTSINENGAELLRSLETNGESKQAVDSLLENEPRDRDRIEDIWLQDGVAASADEHLARALAAMELGNLHEKDAKPVPVHVHQATKTRRPILRNMFEEEYRDAYSESDQAVPNGDLPSGTTLSETGYDFASDWFPCLNGEAGPFNVAGSDRYSHGYEAGDIISNTADSSDEFEEENVRDAPLNFVTFGMQPACLRDLQTWLDKLTMRNFNTHSEAIARVPLCQNLETLSRSVDLILCKAMQNKLSATVCAHLCGKFGNVEAPSPSGNPVRLITIVEDRIDCHLRTREPANTSACKRWLTIIKFAGELHKTRLLSDGIIIRCCERLLPAPTGFYPTDDAKVTALCTLLSTCAFRVRPPFNQNIPRYYAVLEHLVQIQVPTPRTCKHILEALDLRNSNYNPLATEKARLKAEKAFQRQARREGQQQLPSLYSHRLLVGPPSRILPHTLLPSFGPGPLTHQAGRPPIFPAFLGPPPAPPFAHRFAQPPPGTKLRQPKGFLLTRQQYLEQNPGPQRPPDSVTGRAYSDAVGFLVGVPRADLVLRQKNVLTITRPESEASTALPTNNEPGGAQVETNMKEIFETENSTDDRARFGSWSAATGNWVSVKTTFLDELPESLLLPSARAISDHAHHVKRAEIFVPPPSMDCFFEQILSASSTDAFCDIVLRSNDGSVFPAHRFVLFARAPGFAAAILDDIEVGKPLVEVADMDGETLEAFLKFAQNCDGYGIGDRAKELLPVACRYDMEELKRICAAHLENSVTPGNATELLELAFNFNIESLQHATVIFLVDALAESLKSKKAIFVENLGMELAGLILEVSEDH